MKRTISKRSHSWWWDGHISPKNSKWLAENLEEMDQAVKRMLKLIEEDADSFSKKAKMYYQKRPELVAHVEDFYRRYRALAERYDHVTGELRKNVPSALQSQGSGSGSDFGLESPSPSPFPGNRPSHSRQAHRAAGFDVFLGSAHSRKGSDGSSSSSDSESDSSEPTLKEQFSSAGENGNHVELQERISILENELFNTKEKLQACEEGKKVVENGNYEAANLKISKLEDALIKANERTRVLEEEIASLKLELDQNQSLGLTNVLNFKTESFSEEDKKFMDADLEFERSRARELEGQIAALKTEVSNREQTIEELKVELSIANARFLQEKVQMESKFLGLSESRAAELLFEKKRVSSLLEDIVKLNTVISEHESSIVDLKTKISEASERYSKEKHQLEGEISTWKELHSALKSRLLLLEAEVSQLKAANFNMESEIERLTSECAQKDKQVEVLNKEYDAHKLRYDTLVTEKNELFAKMQSLEAVVSSRDDQIRQMDEHLHQLHMEHMQLIKGCEDAKKAAAELSGRVKELEEEVDSQRVVIADNAELKREAIRQLCISLEHYRDGYEKLKQALHGHRLPTVLAS
ncbi:protein NETWORKED 4B-like [Aristolochia californica]|uniref:protein NETWORKED 4B-like n=1 Tax=Aristolochia californica TaxID=171875 RepID=UPI0035D88B56